MKLTDALLGEHGILYALFDHIEETLADAGSVDEIRQAAASLSAALVSHAGIENDLLFPLLEEAVGPDGPVGVMRREHEDVDRLFAHIEAAGDMAEAAEHTRALIALARDHFAKEEQVLFGLAQQLLGDDKLEELGVKWSAIRRVYTG